MPETGANPPSDAGRPRMDDPLPEAMVRQRHGFSAIWLIPLIALTIAGWLGYSKLANQGPSITISFATAEGLEAGRTKVKFKDVEVGEVTKVQVTNNLQNVVVTARMVPDLAPYMTEGTRFWVVKPRIGASGVSGLDTLVSGAFIEIDPGEGEATYTFDGLEDPPLVRFDVPGRQFILEADNLADLTRGAPIYYRGLEVGQVLGYEFSDDRERFDVPVFIRAPHDTLVRDSSRFWTLSAVRLQAGADGVGLEIGTLQSVFTGGIAFDSPDLGDVERAGEGQSFALYPDFSSVGEARFTRSLPFLVQFDGSVRGLRAGAPVEIRGMKIGEVRDVSLLLDPDKRRIDIPVTLDIQPQRISGDPGKLLSDEQAYAEFDALVERGLRAQLKTGSLITGELYIDFVFEGRPGQGGLDYSGDVPSIPAVPSDLDALAASLENVLGRIGALPLEDMAADLQATIRSINERAQAPEIDVILSELTQTIKSVRSVTSRFDQTSEPLMDDLRRTLGTVDRTINKIGQSADAAQGLLGEDSPLRYDVQGLLRELGQAARSIRVFADYLERHPEALLRGKKGGFQ